MAAHPPDLYLAACGKNNKASNILNQKWKDNYNKYKDHCKIAEQNIVPGKGITVNSTPYIRNKYIRDLKEAREKWNNCKEGRVNFRKKCINSKYINDNWPNVPDPKDTHAPPIRDARDKMVDLQRRITNFENDVKQNANKQRRVQFENTAATTAAADEINIEDLYDIKDNKLELNSKYTNGKSKAILRVYIEKIIREAAFQGLPPILSPDELNEVTVRDHGDAYKNLIRKMLIRKIILEKVHTFSEARWYLDRAAVAGGGGGGIDELGGLSAQVIRSAMPPPVTATAFHSGYGADARTRRRHRRARNKKRAERRTRGRSDVSSDEPGIRSSRSSQSSTRRGRSTSTRRGSTRRNSRSRSRSSTGTRRSSRSTGTRRSRSSSRGAAENG